jgi:DNA-binding XRE family transcriptional regulator
MIGKNVVEEIEKLLVAGELSQRQIAKHMGVSRGTVNNIAQGRRVLAKEPELLEEDDYFRPLGPLSRCPSCGGMVHQPCLLCHIRSLKRTG